MAEGNTADRPFAPDFAGSGIATYPIYPTPASYNTTSPAEGGKLVMGFSGPPPVLQDPERQAAMMATLAPPKADDPPLCPLTMEDYENIALISHRVDPVIGFAFHALGMAGEAGEAANEVKKHFRDDKPWDLNTPMRYERRQAVLLELGDVLWYLTATAADLGSNLAEVAALNLDKVTKLRAARAEAREERRSP